MTDSLAFCLYTSNSFFFQKQIKTVNQIHIWRSKGAKMCVSQSLYQIKVLWPHPVPQYHHSFGQGWVESLPFFKPSSFPPVDTISQRKKECPCPQGTPPQGQDENARYPWDLSFFPSSFGEWVALPSTLPHHQWSCSIFPGRDGLLPVVGERERGKWGGVCFELPCFHIFVEKSRNYILILTEWRRHRDSVL